MRYRRRSELRKRYVLPNACDKYPIEGCAYTYKAKEDAEELVAKKKELDALKEQKLKDTKDFEILMRQKASTVGNIVGPGAPVSLTEVEDIFLYSRALNLTTALGR